AVPPWSFCPWPFPPWPFCPWPFPATLVLTAVTFATTADARIAPALIMLRRVRSTFTSKACVSLLTAAFPHRVTDTNNPSTIFHAMQEAILELWAAGLRRRALLYLQGGLAGVAV